ncbi:transposon Ty3-I Gag-Pol polyprotein [Trichonephila clavipes]|nr:transposon Ty3-I Gag-Pol polyprotein [Trichonephila clavipes]
MLKYQVIEMGEVRLCFSPMILVRLLEEILGLASIIKLNEVNKNSVLSLSNIEHRIETVAAAKYITPFLTYKKENWDDHISHIDKVLERIRDARLTIKLAKCKFAQDSVKYLGHVVGLGKRSPAQLKVQTILDFSSSKGLKPRGKGVELLNVSRKWGEGFFTRTFPYVRIDSSEKDMRRTEYVPLTTTTGRRHSRRVTNTATAECNMSGCMEDTSLRIASFSSDRLDGPDR